MASLNYLRPVFESGMRSSPVGLFEAVKHGRFPNLYTSCALLHKSGGSLNNKIQCTQDAGLRSQPRQAIHAINRSIITGCLCPPL
jgi:hypothetical protein